VFKNVDSSVLLQDFQMGAETDPLLSYTCAGSCRFPWGLSKHLMCLMEMKRIHTF
jgi:hypothetical protein